MDERVVESLEGINGSLREIAEQGKNKPVSCLPSEKDKASEELYLESLRLDNERSKLENEKLRIDIAKLKAEK